MGKKIRRRHRADLKGFTITVSSMENPPPPDKVYEALADAFWEWYRRKKQRQHELAHEVPADCPPPPDERTA